MTEQLPAAPLTEPSRFWRVYAIWQVLLAVVMGVVLSLPSGFALSKFGGLEFVPRVTALSLVREQAQVAVFSAAFYAWIWTTHRLTKPVVRSTFWLTARRVSLTWPIAYVFATLLGIASGALAMRICFGLPVRTSFYESRQSVVVGDTIFGLIVSIPYGAVLIAACWFLVPRFAELPWSLTRKIVTAWAVLLAVRIVVYLASAVVA